MMPGLRGGDPAEASRDVSRNLYGRLAVRRPELEQAAVARVTALADPTSAPDPANLHSAVAAALDYGLAAVSSPHREPGPVPVELLAQARLAARNGASLDAVLRGVGAGHTLLSDVLLEEAAALGLGASELHSALRALTARYDRTVAAVSEEHEREAAALPRGPEQRRYQLLRRLLAGEHVDTSSLGYRFEGHHLALVACGQASAPALSRLGESLDRRLLLVEPDAQLAWAWFGGRRAFTCEELGDLISVPWPDGCAIACGEPGEGLSGWRLSHRQATAALPVAQRGTETVVHYAEVALLAAMLADDLLLTSLRRAYLEPLRSDRDEGEAARATLRAYFRAARNLSSAAAALGINRRTVASRLAAVEERLGRPLDAVATELDVALRLDHFESGARQS